MMGRSPNVILRISRRVGFGAVVFEGFLPHTEKSSTRRLGKVSVQGPIERITKPPPQGTVASSAARLETLPHALRRYLHVR